MIQEIIVYVILILVIVYSIYTVIKKVSTKPTSVCEDCTGCGIKHEMIKKGKTNNKRQKAKGKRKIGNRKKYKIK